MNARYTRYTRCCRAEIPQTPSVRKTGSKDAISGAGVALDHVVEQIVAADLHALGRLGNGLVIDVLEKRGTGRQVPHLVRAAPVAGVGKGIGVAVVAVGRCVGVAAAGRHWLGKGRVEDVLGGRQWSIGIWQRSVDEGRAGHVMHTCAGAIGILGRLGIPFMNIARLELLASQIGRVHARRLSRFTTDRDALWRTDEARAQARGQRHEEICKTCAEVHIIHDAGP